MFRQDIFMYLPRKSSVKRGVNYPVIKKSLKSVIWQLLRNIMMVLLLRRSQTSIISQYMCYLARKNKIILHAKTKKDK